jgi:pilus assembly protein FimV
MSDNLDDFTVDLLDAEIEDSANLKDLGLDTVALPENAFDTGSSNNDINLDTDAGIVDDDLDLSIMDDNTISADIEGSSDMDIGMDTSLDSELDAALDLDNENETTAFDGESIAESSDNDQVDDAGLDLSGDLKDFDMPDVGDLELDIVEEEESGGETEIDLTADLDFPGDSANAGDTEGIDLIEQLDDDVSLESDISIDDVDDLSLDFGSDVSLDDSLDLDSDVSLDDSLDLDSDVSLDGSLDLDSDVSLDDSLDLDSDVSLDDSLDLDSDVSLDGSLDLDSDVSLDDSLDLDSDVSLDDSLDLDSDVSLDDSLDLDNDISLDDSLDLDNDISLDDSLDLDNDISLDDSLDLDNDISLDDSLSLDGNETETITDSLDTTGDGMDLESDDLSLKSDLGLEDTLDLTPDDSADISLDHEDFELDILDDTGSPIMQSEEEYGVDLKSGPETIEVFDRPQGASSVQDMLDDESLNDLMETDSDVESIVMPEKTPLEVDDSQHDFLQQDLEDVEDTSFDEFSLDDQLVVEGSNDIDGELDLDSVVDTDITAEMPGDVEDTLDALDDFDISTTEEEIEVSVPGINDEFGDLDVELTDIELENIDLDSSIEEAVDTDNFDIDDSQLEEEVLSDLEEDTVEIGLESTDLDNNLELDETVEVPGEEFALNDDFPLEEEELDLDLELEETEIDASKEKSLVSDEELMDLENDNLPEINSESSDLDDLDNLDDIDSLDLDLDLDLNDDDSISGGVPLDDEIDLTEDNESPKEFEAEITGAETEGVAEEEFDESIILEDEELSTVEEDFLPDDGDLPELDEDIKNLTLGEGDEDATGISPLEDADVVYSDGGTPSDTADGIQDGGSLDELDIESIPTPHIEEEEFGEDETIGLSGDELDNILNSTEIVETEASDDLVLEDVTLEEDIPDVLEPEIEDVIPEDGIEIDEELTLEEDLPDLVSDEPETMEEVIPLGEDIEMEEITTPDDEIGLVDVDALDDDISLLDDFEDALNEGSEEVDLPDLTAHEIPAEDDGFGDVMSETIELDSLDADFNEVGEISLEEEDVTPIEISGSEEEEIYKNLKDEMLTKEPGDTEETPTELKSEVKEVLEYLDHLLDALPEEKIKEFAESKAFETYRKLFEELQIKH